MSVAELKERHEAATAAVDSLRERLRQKRQMLLDNDRMILSCELFLPRFTHFCATDSLVRLFSFFAVAGYSRTQGRAAVSFGSTDLVCCRTLQGHTGKVDLCFS